MYVQHGTLGHVSQCRKGPISAPDRKEIEDLGEEKEARGLHADVQHWRWSGMTAA
jgi:hypothetical protein